MLFGYKTAGEAADNSNLGKLPYLLKQGLGEVHRQPSNLVFLVDAGLITKESDLISKIHGMTLTEMVATSNMNC